MSEPVTTWVVTANGTQELLLGAEGTEGPEGPAGPTGPTGATGATGATGSAGSTGAPGVGVPTGGTTGQVLAKTSGTDYATGWTTPTAATTAAGVTFTPAGSIAATDVQAAIVEALADATAYTDARFVTGTYTPTLSGMVVGTGGTNTATYTAWGTPAGTRMLYLEGQIIFGSSGQTFPTSPSIALPSGYTYATRATVLPPGLCTLYDASGSIYVGAMWSLSTSTLRPMSLGVSGSQLVYSSVSSSSPFTWAVNDQIVWTALLRHV